MKQVKHVFLILCISLLASIHLHAQCVPDATFGNTPGLYPSSLPEAFIGVGYSQVINVVLPEDTLFDAGPFGLIPIDICSVTLDSIPNLPDGMWIDCGGAEPCIFTIDHTDEDTVGRYCLNLLGIPTSSIPNDSLDVYVTVNVGTYMADGDSCAPLAFALPPELTSLVFNAEFIISDPTEACVPDETVGTVPGLYPDTIATAQLGRSYATVINVVVPEDTVVDGGPFGLIPIDICGFIVDSIPNLPAGLSYECNNGDCNFTINHADTVDVTYICVTIYGTPTEMVLPDDSLDVYVSVVPGTYNAATNTCDPLVIALPPDLTSIRYRAKFTVEDVTSIGNLSPRGIALHLFPNPTKNISTLRFDLPTRAKVDLAVYDLYGRRVKEVFNGQAASGSYDHKINMTGLASGLYLVQLKLNGGEQTFTKKLLFN